MVQTSLNEAADILDVGRTAVVHYLKSGRLKAVGRVGRTTLLERADVLALKGEPLRRGRSWSPRIAWAAIALLSGQRVDWLGADELSRIKRRLTGYDVEAVRHLARNRAITFSFDAPENVRGHLESLAVVTGETSLQDAEIARSFGLAGGRGGRLDGYVTAAQARPIAGALGLAEVHRGNVTLRETTIEQPFAAGRTPIAAVALDLMDSPDTRLASAGRQKIKELLGG